MPMAAKTRAFLLAVVLLTAGLAGCAETDDTGDRETGDRDTGDRDTGDRDTQDEEQRDTEDRDTTREDRETFNRTFSDTIDDQNYVRNWTVPANESGANVTIEANISGDAVDDFEATLFTPDGEEVCTVSASGDTGGLGMDDGDNECDEELQDSGDHRLTVWGNATADEAEYWINVTVEPPEQADGGDETTTDDNDSIRGPVSTVYRG